ncbi:30S ribosomal protein S10 [Patescibacteria group bacterium]|jgi:small subunit ribosomal protein S10|nr:30S ribosomal protein S10 [Patescibacteria group bacterium]
MATKTDVSSSRIRIKLRSHDHRLVDQAVRTLIETATRTGAKVVGPVPLPTKNKKWTVNRSTFVHKNAREQYEMRTYTRLVDILDVTPSALEALHSLNLPAGVDPQMTQA